MLEEVTLGGCGFCADLPIGLPERDALEDECDTQDRVRDAVVGGGFGMEQFLDAWVMDTPEPRANNPRAANMDQM